MKPFLNFLCTIFCEPAAPKKKRSGVKALVFKTGRFTQRKHTFMHVFTFGTVPASLLSRSASATSLCASYKATNSRENHTKRLLHYTQKNCQRAINFAHARVVR